ncbi:hypothetical protein HK405_011181 [Cladochytrium tenue]|nr:hypothetical protein HK405_011181 [Cladochytrium tenue]
MADCGRRGGRPLGAVALIRRYRQPQRGAEGAVSSPELPVCNGRSKLYKASKEAARRLLP